MNDILGRLPDSRQTLLFSATLPKVLVEFARAGLSDPVLLRYLAVTSSFPSTCSIMQLFYVLYLSNCFADWMLSQNFQIF